MTRFIQKKIQVADAGATMVHHHEAPSRPDVFNPATENIFLVGLRGSGKTTLGKLLAQRLDLPFVDTDETVVQAAGRSIARIVDDLGWDGFRNLETQALQKVCAEKGQVVATGGGIVLAPENQQLLRQSGTTLYLMAEIPTLLRRLATSPEPEQRPALSDLPLEREIAQSSARRGPLYLCVASHILHTEAPLEKLLEEALDKLGLG